MCDNQYSQHLFLMNDNQLKILRNNLNNRLFSERMKVEILNNKLVLLEKMLYNKCKHKWIIDQNIMSEHTEYVCENCQLHK